MTFKSALHLTFATLLIAAVIANTDIKNAEAQTPQTKEKEDFPAIIPFFDLVSLPRSKQEDYISELRETLTEVAKEEEPGQVRLFVQGEDLPTSFIKQILFTSAYAQGYNPLVQKCDNGQGDQVLCVNNATGTNTQCLCAHTRDSFVNEYGNNYLKPAASSSGCDMSSDSGANQDITSHYVTVWVGGSASCVSRQSYDNVQNQIGNTDLKSSLHDALGDAEKSKVFADKSKRTIRTDDLASQLASGKPASNPISGVQIKSVYRGQTDADVARTKAMVALMASERVKDESRLVNAADPTARQLAREQTNKSLKLMEDAAANARAEGINASIDMQKRLLEAQKIDPARPNAEVIDAVGDGIDAAGATGAAATDLKKAGENLGDSSKNMNPAADDLEGLKLRGQVTKDSAEAKAQAQELLTRGQQIADQAAATLKGPIDAAAGDKQAKLKALQASLQDLKASIGRGAKDDIVANTAAANEKIKEVRKNLNLPNPPPSDHADAPALANQKPHDKGGPAEAPVTCIKTGTFKCPNKSKKDGTLALDKARAGLLAQDGEKSCIFGGNASTFGANVEGRGVKSRKGCAPKFDFDLKIGETNYKLTCPAAKKNERLVICNPVLFGYEASADGTPAQAHCVDWTSTVTADCGIKFPLRKAKPASKVAKAGAPTTSTVSVSPIDLLNNGKAQLEPGWESLSRAISRHCNTENFRSLNCAECEHISNRLGQMKIKATAGTCTWPSELGTIRNSLKGNSNNSVK